MKNIFILLLSSLIYLFLFERAVSQTSDEKPGFWIEANDENSNNLISNTFINFEQLKKLPLDSALARAKNEKPMQTWYGANLGELFKTAAVPYEKIKKLSISAPDGYTAVISGELLAALKTAICAYKVQQTKHWNEDNGDMRFIFPELRSMYWVNSPNKIVIIIGQNQSTLNQYQFYFLDNEKFSRLVKKDSKGTSCLVIDNLLVELNLPQNNFHVLTSDGLFREYPKNDINRNFVLQKQESGAWELNGINVPSGLKTREIIFLSSDTKGIFLKELTDEEQQKWGGIFWQPLVGDIFSVLDLKIELVSSSGKKIISNLSSKLNNENFSMYDFLIESRIGDLDFNYFEISW